MTPLALAGQLFALPLASNLRLIGGLGVRVLAGSLARSTLDVDLVAANAAAGAAFRNYLEGAGWRVGDAGAYWRARKVGEPAIDVFSNPVANPRTFESMKLSDAAMERTVDGTRYFVASPHDIAFLKLCAGRDQDAIDVAILGSKEPLAGARLVQIAEANDLEIRLAEGAQRFRNLLARQALEPVADELLARPLTIAERDGFDELLMALLKEGC